MPKRETVTRYKQSAAIYHSVLATEGFMDAVQAIYDCLWDAQDKFPGKRRMLHLDIEGHRNPAGGWDPDMYELQVGFLIGFLGRYFSEMHLPLGHVVNKQPQDDDIPRHLDIKDPTPS